MFGVHEVRPTLNGSDLIALEFKTSLQTAWSFELSGRLEFLGMLIATICNSRAATLHFASALSEVFNDIRSSIGFGFGSAKWVERRHQ